MGEDLPHPNDEGSDFAPDVEARLAELQAAMGEAEGVADRAEAEFDRIDALADHARAVHEGHATQDDSGADAPSAALWKRVSDAIRRHASAAEQRLLEAAQHESATITAFSAFIDQLESLQDDEPDGGA